MRSHTRIPVNIRDLLAVSIAVVGLLASAGCGKEEGHRATPPQLPPQLPSKFDPCKDIPADVLASLNLVPEGRVIPARTGGPLEQYKGCDYRVQAAAASEQGPDVFIQVTNMTIDYFANNYAPERQFTRMKIGGREVATAAAADPSSCTLLIALRDGGVQVGPNVIDRDPCRSLVDVATAVIPHIPQDA
ncbi:hypothetical protein C5E51_18350 [Nocardia nova]|uniref:DUF3558 domain-containing protein n=1 Tax=Nocardia nova TaxID=37330 RepID=UPI000CEA4332|nr:DUF3558 domain-containing protein [Nocardia nova]PPJ07148.1 hypothetical protein C5E51_18350 [Nocardia nova]